MSPRAWAGLNAVLLALNAWLAWDRTPRREFPLLSPRVQMERSNDLLVNFTELRADLRRRAGPETALYFEYLPTGVSIGVGETRKSRMMSLLKVPVVMAVFRQLERGRMRKEQTLTLAPEHVDRRFGSLWKLGAGGKLTVEEALRAALQESDNTAVNALLPPLPPGALAEVADYLDVPQEKEEGYVVISPKGYASILRCLYLSSFLSRASSEEILALLSRTPFSAQLRAGVPSGVPVAHKIGVFDAEDSKTVFSDCGIVYAPRRPYLLCLMVRAGPEEADRRMKDISKRVFDAVSGP